MPTPTRVEANIGTDDNVPDTSIYWSILYASIIEMMFYMESNIKLGTSFDVHQYERFNHNTKALHETSVNSIQWYLQCTTYKGMMFNPQK